MDSSNNQDLYKIDLMRTLWQNTYRGTVFDSADSYVATIRLFFGIPLDRSEVPKDAPQVNPYISVIVEDTVLRPIDVLDFEEAASRIIVRMASSKYFQPDRCMFFYPSPAESAETAQDTPADQPS